MSLFTRPPALALCLAAALVAACGDDGSFAPGTDGVPDATARLGKSSAPGQCAGVPRGTTQIVVTPTKGALAVGDSMDLDVFNQAQVAVPDCALNWSSSATDRATVGYGGRVRGVAPGGPITVTARTSGRQGMAARASLTVLVASDSTPGTSPTPAPVAAVQVSPTTATITVGGTTRLTAVAQDAVGAPLADRLVAWASSAPGVATVGADGTVTAVAAGTAAISATSEGVTGTAVVTVQAPAIAPSAGSVALRIVRLDSTRTDSVIISAGLPFPRGKVQASMVDGFRIVIGGVEVPRHAEALQGRHPDGSVRSVLLQFATTPAQLASEIRLDLTGRQLAPRAAATPTGRPAAVVVPTSLEDYVASGIVGRTRTRAQSPTSAAYFTDYENRFGQWEQTHWGSGSAVTTANFYDRVMAYFGFWARTATPRYFARGADLAIRFREQYVKPADYKLPEWLNGLEGTMVHYLLTGDRESLRVIELVASQTEMAYGPDAWLADTQHEWMDNRVQARVLGSKVLAIMLGFTRTSAHSWAPGMTDVKAAAASDLTAILSTQRADGSYGFRSSCGMSSNFMTGLLNGVLAQYYDEVTPDARVLTAVQRSQAFLMGTQWNATAGGFQYYSGYCAGHGDKTIAGDLNGLFLSGMASLYARTGDAAVRTAAEDVFRGGVANAYLTGEKQFNQWYMLSWRWLGAR